MSAKKLLEELAGGVHATVGGANLLIAIYNFKKKNYLRALFHVAIAGYEGHCFHEHWSENANDTKVVEVVE